MPEAQLHRAATFLEIGLGVITVVALFFVTAPYGRHQRRGWGPEVGQRLGWVLMELPAVAVWAAIFALGEHRAETAPLAMLAIWQLHYVHRTFVFPLRIPAANKTTPLSIVGMAVVFNVLNAYVNARWVSHFGAYDVAWLSSPQFLGGLSLFLVGFVINVRSDYALLALRKSRGDGGYSVPRGGLFELVSCPNYFGELLEWIGWAILTWSLSGAAFAIYTAANLVPRAISHHRWYREKFPDYPPSRRAVVPFLL